MCDGVIAICSIVFQKVRRVIIFHSVCKFLKVLTGQLSGLVSRYDNSFHQIRFRRADQRYVFVWNMYKTVDL